MKKQSPLVSILMPVFHAEKFIAQAINSILKQDYSNWELLILNDASTDGTQQIIDTFHDERINVFHHSKNEGYLLSCNALFGKATGDFITFLDADDVCKQNRLSMCLSTFKNDPTLDFITTDYQRVSKTGMVISDHTAAVDYKRYASDSGYFPTICCATAFVRKELLLQTGGYRPFFKNIGGEDYFWLWELSKAGTGKHVNKMLYSYRFHAEQTSKNHGNKLSLFLPELLGELRSSFNDANWNEVRAKNIEMDIYKRLCSSDFELNLRKAQHALNHGKGSFWHNTFRSLRKVRKAEDLRAILYLIYSWAARKGRNANQ